MTRLILIALLVLLYPQAIYPQNSFLSRVQLDPDIVRLGQKASNIIEGKGEFTTNFAAIAEEVAGSGENINEVYDVSKPPYSVSGDGNRDASSGINLAYKHASENGGGTILIPPGTYRLLHQVKPLSNTRTIAHKATFDRAFHNSENRNSNAPGSGLILIEEQSNCSWVGGIITNGNGIYRGRAFEAINSRHFEIGEMEIYYHGLYNGKPQGSVGMFITSCEDFYIHDLISEPAYLGDAEFPHPVGNTCFRFADCKRGVIYHLKGACYDNIMSMTATNENAFLSQHDILVIDFDSRQVDTYGRASAILVGTSGSQPNHRGEHYNIYYIDLKMEGPGDITEKPQPQFQVINRSKNGAYVHDIHFVGAYTIEDSWSALRISQGGNNKGIDNIYITQSTLISTNKFGLETSGKTQNIYIDEATVIKGNPAIHTSESTTLHYNE